MDTVRIDDHEYAGLSLPTEKSTVLLLRGERGFLGCGYFSVATADVLGEAVAIVRGVKSYEDMLAADVVEVSARAAELGVTVGCSGMEALLAFTRRD